MGGHAIPDPVATFEWDRADGPTDAIVRTMDTLDGVDESDAEPLDDVIDPNALNGLFRNRTGRQSGSVRFVFRGYWILVHASGAGYVFDPDDIGNLADDVAAVDDVAGEYRS